MDHPYKLWPDLIDFVLQSNWKKCMKWDWRFTVRKPPPFLVAWEMVNGPLPPDTKLVQKCQTVGCVNPLHRKTMRAWSRQAEKSHGAPKGGATHPFLVDGYRVAIVPLTQGYYAVIDAEDMDRVAVRRWHAADRGGGEMWPATLDGRKRVWLRDFLGEPESGWSVNPLDVRRRLRTEKTLGGSCAGQPGGLRWRIGPIWLPDGRMIPIDRMGAVYDEKAKRWRRTAGRYGPHLQKVGEDGPRPITFTGPNRNYVAEKKVGLSRVIGS